MIKKLYHVLVCDGRKSISKNFCKNTVTFSKIGFLAFLICFAIASEKTHAMEPQIKDGQYSIEVTMAGGSGKASVETPTLMTVKDGICYADITWSSSNYDYMIVDGQRYENQAESGRNSMFQIPVTVFDEDVEIIADTLAMGEPREVVYEFHFYSDSIGSKGQLPQEAARRVLMMAGAIIVVGGILNSYVNKKRRQDYTGSHKGAAK